MVVRWASPTLLVAWSLWCPPAPGIGAGFLGVEAGASANSAALGPRTIAYVYNDPSPANPAGVNHVYIMRVDGNGASLGAKRLTSFAEAEDYPAWSPDGASLLVIRQLEGSAIYKISADGTGTRRLSPRPARDIFAAWSPDGAHIVYTRLLTDPPSPGTIATPPKTEIRVMNADGSGDHAILTSLLSVEPDWSAKNKIVFMSQMEGKNFDVFTMNPDGSEIRRLTKGHSNNGDPKWSPDGTKISFGSDREGRDKLNVFVMNADGSDPKALTFFETPVEVGDTHWSADGAQIVFEHDLGGKKQSDPTARAEVWIMASDGRAPTSTHQACSNVGCSPRFKPFR